MSPILMTKRSAIVSGSFADEKAKLLEEYKDLSQMIPDEPKVKKVIREDICSPKALNIPKPLITEETRYMTKPLLGNKFKVYMLDKPTETVKGVYEGQMKEGLPQGAGKVTFEDGSVYEGNWSHGEYHGQGKLSSSTFSYEGGFKDSLFDGEGKLTLVGVGEYEGMFSRGKFSGYGIFRWIKGKIYRGHWRDNHMHLKGMLVWPDGRKYIGNFSMGKKEGKGYFYFAGGLMMEATWKGGKVEHIFQKREASFIPELIAK